MHQVRRAVFSIYLPLTELALLSNRESFSHCGAIEKDGKVVLFPASGGVGKTSIMSKYASLGWRFLSDDFCIINADGTAFTHALPMHIYKFHEIHSPRLVQEALAAGSAWDRMLWSLMSRFKKPDRLVRWVAPEKVFGLDRMARSGRIAAVVHMQRMRGGNAFSVRELSPDQAAEKMANTLLDEVEALAATSIKINLAGGVSFVPQLDKLFASIRGIYTSAVKGARCVAVDIPQQAGMEEVFAFIEKNKLTDLT